MALSSERKQSSVNPAEGMYVEMEGVMEVRWSSEDIDNQPPSIDFYRFQNETRHIPDDFCHKDKQTTLQAFFFCIVCECELKSIKSLQDHCKGTKHIRKACEKKRIIFDLPAQPKNAPRIKKLKRPQPRIDLNKSLKERLEDSAQPAVGLQFVEEYRNPDKKTDHRMYSCKLTGCKSAWGNSDDMYNHVIKYKHAKNFFKLMHPEDMRIAGLSNAEVLAKAAEIDDDEERDYDVIIIVNDFERYKELRDRPDDWSEKKQKMGIMGKSFNSNMEPLGSKGGRSLGGGSGSRGLGGSNGIGTAREDDRKQKRRVEEEPLFDEEAWKDWKPPSQADRVERWMKSMRKVARNIQETAEDFEGNSRESAEYKAAIDDIDDQRKQLDFDQETGPPPQEIEDKYWEWVNEMKAKFSKAEEILNEKTDGQERELKHIAKLMAEFEEEIQRYHANRDSRKYKNIKERYIEVTKELSYMKCTTPYHDSRKADFNARLGSLWKNFEENSDDREPPLSALLESHMKDKSRGEKRIESKEKAVEIFKKDLMVYIRASLDKYKYNPHLKIEGEKEFNALSDYIRDKIFKVEINAWIKGGWKWENFCFRDNQKKATDIYIKPKMERYVPGSIFNQ